MLECKNLPDTFLVCKSYGIVCVISSIVTGIRLNIVIWLVSFVPDCTIFLNFLSNPTQQTPGSPPKKLYLWGGTGCVVRAMLLSAAFYLHPACLLHQIGDPLPSVPWLSGGSGGKQSPDGIAKQNEALLKTSLAVSGV